LTLDLRPDEAGSVIASLRMGQPPERFVSAYSVGTTDFLDDVRSEHLESGTMFGQIRFISGTWGAGKTHFLRLLRESAFGSNYLVGTVDLDQDEAPLHKFERVFYRIVQSVTSPEMYRDNDLSRVDPLGEVLRRSLFAQVGEDPTGTANISPSGLREAQESLYGAPNIDPDVKRIVDGYWKTYVSDAGDVVALEEQRALALGWFKAEGTLPPYRKAFGVNKLVNRSNARIMLQSLSRLTRHLGYEGLVLLLDEGELSTSLLRRSNVRDAHNNLRDLIDGIQSNQGLFAVYAATPDFFENADYGVRTYGALAQRIGQLPDGPPAAYARVWNLDKLTIGESAYEDAASRIRDVYLSFRPESLASVVDDAGIRNHIRGLVKQHPERATVSTWRIVTQGSVDALDASVHGRLRTPDEAYRDLRRQITD